MPGEKKSLAAQERKRMTEAQASSTLRLGTVTVAGSIQNSLGEKPV